MSLAPNVNKKLEKPIIPQHKEDKPLLKALKPLTKAKPILEVEGLSVSFTQYSNGLRQKELQVISDLNLDLYLGEIMAVVGSSGSGKSLLAHAILGILPNNATVTGKIAYKGDNINADSLERLRGREIALVPQTVNYLDPLMRVGKQVQKAAKDRGGKKAQKEIFNRYNLRPEVSKFYPFQLSGGMARRVLVSTAVVSEAELIIADEPTPGLDDVSVTETLNYFRELAKKGSSVILITHDIETALKVADRIAVFYAGTTVEVAPVEDFKGKGETLRHPYSKALWRALPQNEFLPIPGFQPLPNALPEGCLFQPRCQYASSKCAKVRPKARDLRNGIVRCNNAT